MDKSKYGKLEGTQEATAAKKPYRAPVIQTYGKLHLVTQGTGGTASDSAQNMTKAQGSDASIKENIVRIGDHPLGVGIYLFDYKPAHQARWGRGRQFGVIAQEVETVMPQAVSTHPDGYKLVNYAMLGISHSIQ